MEKTLGAKNKAGSAKKEKIDYKAEIAKMFAEMDVIDEHIRRTQAETTQLQAETRVMLDSMKADYSVA
ncbi:MAG: hypothetical protein ACRYFS_00370 [Janthinobacterium lividum]